LSPISRLQVQPKIVYIHIDAFVRKPQAA
jgi:hypothetical protein